MSGRILVVDDIEPNRRLLQTRLEADYYIVDTAADGAAALEAVAAEPPDLILLDVMMPGIDGFEVCRRLKADEDARHIPVVLVTALANREDRVEGLQAGADDFITKPIYDLGLMARVRSLLRLKTVMDELRSREAAGRALGLSAGRADEEALWTDARILVVDDPGRTPERMAAQLKPAHRPVIETDPRAATQTAAQGRWDLMLLNLAADSFDGMRVAARLRSDAATRNLPIIAIVNPHDRDRTVKALEVGVNDLLDAPVDAEELAARVRTQIKRKRYADYLRATLDEGLELSVTDQLTGLNNRRFMMAKLGEWVAVDHPADGGCALMIADIDHFKRINDTYGHDAGDAVLRDFAGRLSATVRAVDHACRYGGEEFVVLMPESDLSAAHRAAERVRQVVEGAPFRLPDGREISVTASAGVARLEPGDTAEKIVKRADRALYAAKERGRNRVMVAKLKRAA